MKNSLSKAGYIFDSSTKIWARAGYDGIAYSDGDEIETRIARIVAQAADVSVLSSELRQHCTDWPTLYHLDGNRANILRPFEQSLSDADVLEIGAGCGAITRYLGECGARVLALEGTLRRAAIARSRTRDLPNVKVLADRFDDFVCDRKFDVITLIGVLEYANLFTQAENPPLAMLQRARDFLNPGGKIIIAIENQMGLKYFAGAPEDHLGQAMYGIEGRYRGDQPRTYGRQVLSNLLMETGFESVDFLAPFPDYKLPLSIVTENGLSSKNFDAAAFAWQSVRHDPQLPALLAFSPELVWPTLAQNGLLLDLSNSFLVVAGNGNKQILNSDTLAWHFTTRRAKRFCKVTRFQQMKTGGIEVHYRALVPEAHTPFDGDRLKFVLPKKARYIQGLLLSREFIHIVSRDGWRMEEVGDYLRKYIDVLCQIDKSLRKFKRINGAGFELPGYFFDLIPRNIIVSGDEKYSIIDREWEYNDALQAGFLVFRVLWNLLHTVTKFGQSSENSEKTILGFIHAAFASQGWSVTKEMIHEYVHLEAAIYTEVTGYVINPEDMLTRLNADLGAWQNLSQAVTARDTRISSLTQSVAEHDSRVTHLIQTISERDARISERDGRIADLDGHIENLGQTIAERDGRIADLDGHIENLGQTIAERDGRIADLDGHIENLGQTIAERDGRIADLDGHIENLGQTIAERDAQIFERDNQLASLSQKLSAIINSRSWKITRPFRFAGRLVRGEFQTALSPLRPYAQRVDHQFRRIHLLWRILPTVIRLGGGLPATAVKTCRVLKREGVEGILRRLRSVSHEAPVVQEDNHGLIRPQVVLISHRQDGKYHFAGRPNEYVYTDTASHDLGDQYIDQRHINDNVIPSEQYCEWPKDVRTLRMPWFTSSSNIEIDNYTIGIFLHIFYTELARELVDAIKNIPWSVKVYVSTDTFEKKNIIASELEYAGFTDKYEIRILPNKGWDIAPFLIGFSDRIREHEIILRLHSKRSSHISEEKGTEWRSLLISSLVGSPERVQSILAAFVRCSNLGMVCTEHWHAILPFINAETDCGNMNRLLPLGYDIAINDPIDFPSGSMFWCRSKTLEPFLSKNFSWDDFAPTDERERWNTLAHAVERTFFFMCGFSGFQWSRVPQLEQSYKSDALLDGPWVSVILTSYNYAKYIGVSITSVLSQTWKSWELIIIDDGSTDASLDIIASFVAEDPRVSLLRHPDGGNHGLSASLQYAIQHAKHEIIAFLESDDFWCESYLEEHLKAMGKHKADATYCGVTCLAQPGAQQRLPSFRDYLSFCEENVPDKDKSFTLNATLRKRNVIPTMSCAVVKSSLLKNCNFDPPVAVWIDWWLWLQMDRAQFFYVDKKMTFWRVHAKSYHSKQEISEEETHALYALMRRQYDSLRI